MADRRRRLRVKADDDSEDISSESDVEPLDASFNSVTSPEKKEGEKPESECESAEEEDNVTVTEQQEVKETKVCEEDIESPTELIDEEGGVEGIAEQEDVDGEFLDEGILEASDEGGEEEEEEEDGECVEEERQQGDGEECSPEAEKELDFDEDRRNPQYIPKKGTFYEHDDRNMSESPKEKEPEPARDKKKKKLWLDEGKWGHDRYREDEQTPKSRDELIEAYGYDIRCEDCPPRARRRRRYGRGPTKYDRNWEDEGAYSKEHIYNIFRGSPRGGQKGRGRGGQMRGAVRGGARRVVCTGRFNNKESDVSSLHNFVVEVANDKQEPLSDGWGSTGLSDEKQDKPHEEEESISIINNNDFPALNSTESVVRSHSPEQENLAPRLKKAAAEALAVSEQNLNNSVRTQTFENSNYGNNNNNRVKTSSYEKPPRQMKSPSFRGSYRGAYKRPPTNFRGKRGAINARYKSSRDSYTRPTLAPRLMEKQIRAVTTDLEHFTLDEKTECFDNGDPAVVQDLKSTSNKMNGMKPTNGQSSKNEDSSSRPKRYSSLRQRSLPETTNYQPTQPPSVAPPHPPYYDTTYQAAMYAPDGVVPPTSTQPQTTGSPPLLNPPQYQTYNPAAYQESYALRLPVNNAPRLFPQVTLPAGQPLMAPTPCITANPGIINYPPPPPPPATAYPQFTYQQYPAPPPAPPTVSQTPELYRSGITYYYPQNQHPQVRHVPLKRPKAAIPIVPPPENERKSSEKKELDAGEEQRRNSLPCLGDSANPDSELIRTEPSSVEVES